MLADIVTKHGTCFISFAVTSLWFLSGKWMSTKNTILLKYVTELCFCKYY